MNVYVYLSIYIAHHSAYVGILSWVWSADLFPFLAKAVWNRLRLNFVGSFLVCRGRDARKWSPVRAAFKARPIHTAELLKPENLKLQHSVFSNSTNPFIEENVNILCKVLNILFIFSMPLHAEAKII